MRLKIRGEFHLIKVRWSLNYKMKHAFLIRLPFGCINCINLIKKVDFFKYLELNKI